MSDEIKEIDFSGPAFLLSLPEILTSPPYARVLEFLLRMQHNPPQALLIEGGCCSERMAAALLWACMLNCPEKATNGMPCLVCHTCQRFIQVAHRDFFVLDGREESIKIAQVREQVRPVLGEAPREAQKRIILLAEAQSLGEAAANALLKSMEEPRPHNAFILTTPQRERLLPTLISRSWILTLPWPLPGKSTGLWAGMGQEQMQKNNPNLAEQMDHAHEELELENALAQFLRSGKGWFSRTGTRGTISAPIATALLSRCESALASSMLKGQHAAGKSPLALIFSSSANPTLASRAYQALGACQTALHYNVNPALVMDWLATKLFIWLEEIRRSK